MIPRKRLDIGWTDLLYGIKHCLWPQSRKAIETRLEQLWSEKDASLVCLSVRSGFDALLHTLNFPAGTEILVSAVTIRGMIRVIEAHGLVPIPIDLDFTRLEVRPESMAKGITTRTRAILVAHLFGSRMPMEPILRFAQAHSLVVMEDCAQAYVGDRYHGHPQSDISLFSFGPIKTATALAGGFLCFRDPSLRNAVRRYQDQWPISNRLLFLVRICKYAVLVLLSYRVTYSIFIAVCRLLNVNHDQIIASSVRGFSGDRFFAKIRQRPSSAVLALLERRLRRFDQAKISERKALAEQAIALMPSLRRPGDRACEHTYWVFPILHEHPEQLMAYVWEQGFDATQGGSSLYVIPPPVARPEMRAVEAEQVFEQLLYLPIYVGVSVHDLEKLAKVCLSNPICPIAG
ncbi:MAG: DegT/DnrJ/EryC1/StrS family aminotransferase [Cyanobacteria bacterium P01_A01_bin.123]